ncbi:MAG: SOS response-associated peptidase family protein [Pseudomonadota bacterium]
MCFAFTLEKSIEQLSRVFNIKKILDEPQVPTTIKNPNYITPRSNIICVTQKSFQTLTWGASIYEKFLYNARDDKLLTSRFWKAAFHQQRCIIPADGWYDLHKEEHQTLTKIEAQSRGLTSTGKRQYYFHFENRPCFAIAAIYGKKTQSSIMITTQADTSITHLHHRMPAIISQNYWEAFLDPATSAHEALAMLQPVEESIYYFASPKPIDD